MTSIGITRAAAAAALVGGVVNLVCDVMLTPGYGPGDVIATPTGIATTLAGTPSLRLALATVVGALAISTWVLATPALVRLVSPAGHRIATVVGGLHVIAVGGCVMFHVATGCLAWVGTITENPDSILLEPLWQLIQRSVGITFLALAIALAVAAWKSREVPKWLVLASPLVSMSIFAIPASMLPAPVGLPIALSSSTVGACGWLFLLWRSSRRASRSIS